MVDTCPCCGAIVYKEPMFNSKIKQGILDFVRRHPGASAKKIIDTVYSDREDGGPESFNIVAVHISGMRPVLRKNGLDIKATRGPWSMYNLVKFPVKESSQ